MGGVHLTVQRWDVQAAERKTLPVLIDLEYDRTWFAERVPEGRRGSSFSR
jgi:hypothetical protein